jgi:DNA-binding LytR/AlgR family response regulator
MNQEAALRRRLTPDPGLVRGVSIALAAGLLLAFTGAFGMGHTPFWFRVAYWEPVMLLGALWGHLCSNLVGRWIDSDQRPWLAAAVLTAVISGPLSVMIWAITGRFFDDDGLVLARLDDFVAPVTVVTAVLSLLNIFLERTPRQTHAAAAPAPRFLDRMPPHLRGSVLWAVQAEDHYLRLHTDRGSDLILMRLTDAVSELEGLEGARTHRSWWVARKAVQGVRRGDGRATLLLPSGVEAPVSRRYARALRQAGWW